MRPSSQIGAKVVRYTRATIGRGTSLLFAHELAPSGVAESWGMNDG